MTSDLNMPFDDLIVERPPTAGAPADEPDGYFYEGAVMLAYAMHLLETEPTHEVRIHPDGQHAKQFEWHLRERERPPDRHPFAPNFPHVPSTPLPRSAS
jgi:hypothetical protein